MEVRVYDKKKKKWVHVGNIKGKTFFKTVERKKHYCYKHGGYGIQTKAFVDIHGANCSRIEIHVKDTGQRLISRPDDWVTEDDLGHGLQLFLAENKMTGETECISEKLKTSPKGGRLSAAAL